jgi:hypothetical protein
MDYYNVTSEINLNNANTGADMQANTNTAISNNVTTGANMQATQPYSVVTDIQTVNQQLKNFEVREATIKSASDKQLYALLGQVFDICLYLLNPLNDTAQAEFSNYCTGQTGKDYKKEKLITYVLTFCFDGLDSNDTNVRKKIYAYKTVINFAISERIPAGGFVAFVNSKGGLEKARNAKYEADRVKNGVSAPQSVVQQAQTYITQKPISVIAESVLQANLPNTPIGQPFVLVMTRLGNGQVAMNAVTTEDTAVAAAMRGIYKVEKDAIKAFTPVPVATPRQQVPNVVSTNSISTDALSIDAIDYVDEVEAAIAAVPEFAA